MDSHYRIEAHPVTGVPERLCRDCGKYPSYCQCPDPFAVAPIGTLRGDTAVAWKLICGHCGQHADLPAGGHPPRLGCGIGRRGYHYWRGRV